MTDEQILAMAAPYVDLTNEMTVEFQPSQFTAFVRVLLAASKGRAEPVAWMTEGKYPSPRFIIGNTDPSGVWKEKYVPLYLNHSAEIAALNPDEEFCKAYAEEWQDTLKEQSDCIKARDAELTALRERIAGMEKDARDAEPTAWRYETDYGTIYQSMQLDHTYADANGEYIKGTPLYLAPCPSTTKFEPATRVVMTYEGENFSDVDRALPFGTPLFTAAQMRQAERDALERAAALIEPKNDMDDWTDWARTRYEAAQQIRGLKEPKQ